MRLRVLDAAMSLPGKKAAAGAGGIRRWLSTAVLSALALVLILVVISLSVGSPLPGASLHEYPAVRASDPKGNATADDGSKNDIASGVPLPGKELQGGQEPLAEHSAQNGTLNSSEGSLNTREVDDTVPDPVSVDSKIQDPVATDDTTPKLNDSQRADQGEL